MQVIAIMEIPARRSAANTLVSKLLRAFSVLPKSEIARIEEDLDDTIPGNDLWNSALTHRNPTERESPTGPAQSASGSGGVKMVGQYAQDADHGDSLVAQYAELARRLNSAEKAIKSIATLLSVVMKADADEGDGEGEEDEDEENDGDDVEKAGIPSLSIADLMLSLAGRTKAKAASQRRANARVNTPPSFIGKGAHVADIDSMLDDGNLTTAEAVDLATYKARLAAYRDGKLDKNRVTAGLHNLPSALRVSA